MADEYMYLSGAHKVSTLLMWWCVRGKGANVRLAVIHYTVELLPHFARNQRICHFRRLVDPERLLWVSFLKVRFWPYERSEAGNTKLPLDSS